MVCCRHHRPNSAALLDSERAVRVGRALNRPERAPCLGVPANPGAPADPGLQSTAWQACWRPRREAGGPRRRRAHAAPLRVRAPAPAAGRRVRGRAPPRARTARRAQSMQRARRAGRRRRACARSESAALPSAARPELASRPTDPGAQSAAQTRVPSDPSRPRARRGTGWLLRCGMNPTRGQGGRVDWSTGELGGRRSGPTAQKRGCLQRGGVGHLAFRGVDCPQGCMLESAWGDVVTGRCGGGPNNIVNKYQQCCRHVTNNIVDN